MGRRGLRAAALASAAVHGLLAWGLAGLRAPPASTEPPAVEVLLVSEFRSPAPGPQARRSSAGPPAARPRRPAPRASLPAPAGPQFAALAGIEPAVFRATPAEPAAAPPPSMEEDPLVAYRRRVWAQLDAAAPRGSSTAAAAKLGFAIDARGALLSLRLVRASGDPKFDRACLTAVRAAAPFPAPPPGAQPTDLVFEVSVRPRPAQ